MRIEKLPFEYKRAYEILGARLGINDIKATVVFVEEDAMVVGSKDGKGYIKCAKSITSRDFSVCSASIITARTLKFPKHLISRLSPVCSIYPQAQLPP